jgi:rsbT co-antagonist protein RsbR
VTPSNLTSHIADIVRQHRAEILNEWMSAQLGASGEKLKAADFNQLRQQAAEFLEAFVGAAESGSLSNAQSPAWSRAREILGDISASRARQGFTPSQTAVFVFSLKESLFQRIRDRFVDDTASLADETWTVSKLLDQLGLYTTERFLQTREETISRQQQELLELSTPVVSLWDNVLALPLIGTLDSARTQVVMENLLQAIVQTRSDVAIIDITGVPTVDTLVAQHLLKTVAAARLMGAECIISGIRPQIAQTIIHLGVDLGGVITKATLADAFTIALKRTGFAISRQSAAKQ